ncbi:hypothetical protein IQ227_25125 [Anabaena aphanizomenioides LEGE 00250]|uniref:RiboL-PSP-HEPN domain-containing protein n=2 Tax=Sphaerospermopsis TaxID=752201 RepID=A0A480A9A6_9CYAN|nr:MULTISPECIES: MAE_28990/MAE_18760 family HEPN-like nuclease [Sphaerospermopsis]MBE9239201.1 hypothetical protein [Sphaerospermopsis aphanizomenoides LEGE 00250]GCL38714.1 hypothetical protein SR1949_38330 [Sphaerospermopsis reniformis]
MFDELLKTVKDNISTIRAIIKTNEKIRDIAFGDVSVYPEETKIVLMDMFQDIPEATDWRVYDQCAVVTRLYAIYESFVEDLIQSWVILLPDLYPNYLDLNDAIRKTHQSGVGRLLQEILREDNNRYKLSAQKVILGLLNGETGENKYELLPEAFLFHEQNLRKNSLERLLASAGIIDSWSWVVNHRDIKNFLKEIRGNQTTLEKEMNIFISYRNDAAHSTKIEDWLGFKPLLELCDFVESLCQALTELVNYQVLQSKESIGQVQEVGKITEWFKKPQAGVFTAYIECSLSVGSTIILVGESYCQEAKIESIKYNDQSITDEIKTTTGMEVGLKFDVEARKDLRLYKLTT